jgi:hypothetical protein
MNFEFDYTELAIKRDSKILIQTLLAFRKHYSEEKKKALAIYEKEEFSPRLAEKKKHNQSLQVIGEEESIEIENKEVSIKSIEEKKIFFGENDDAINKESVEAKKIIVEADEENVESEHSIALSKKSMGTKKVIFQEEADDEEEFKDEEEVDDEEEDQDEVEERINDALSKKSGENLTVEEEESQNEKDQEEEEEGEDQEENLEGEHIDAISRKSVENKKVIFEEESKENNDAFNKGSEIIEEEQEDEYEDVTDEDEEQEDEYEDVTDEDEEEQEDEYEDVTDEEDEDEEENLEENIDKLSKNSVENKKLIVDEGEKSENDNNSLNKESNEDEVYEECIEDNDENRKRNLDGIEQEISIDRKIRNQLIDINKKLDKQKEITCETNLYINYKTKPSVYRINEANGQLEALFENDLLAIQEENESDAEDSFRTIKSKNSDNSDPELKFNELNTSLSAPESTEFENINNDLKNSPEKKVNSSTKNTNNRSVVFKMKTHVIF